MPKPLGRAPAVAPPAPVPTATARLDAPAGAADPDGPWTAPDAPGRRALDALWPPADSRAPLGESGPLPAAPGPAAPRAPRANVPPLGPPIDPPAALANRAAGTAASPGAANPRAPPVSGLAFALPDPPASARAPPALVPLPAALLLAASVPVCSPSEKFSMRIRASCDHFPLGCCERKSRYASTVSALPACCQSRSSPSCATRMRACVTSSLSGCR